MRALIFLVTLGVLPGSLTALFCSIQMLIPRHEVVLFLGLGFVLGFGLDQIVFRRLGGFETFEHELTHAVASLLFFRRVTAFKVTSREGGWMEYTGGFGGMLGDDFIGLAPYVLPTFTVISVLVRPLLRQGGFPWFDLWIGATLGFHTWSTIRETRLSWTSRTFHTAGTRDEVTQSDIARRGFVYSAVYILSVTAAIHAALFYMVALGYPGLEQFWHVLWRASAIFWTLCWTFLTGQLSKIL